jgi:hypothetical protein
MSALCLSIFKEIVRRLGPKCIHFPTVQLQIIILELAISLPLANFKLKSLMWWPNPQRANAKLRAGLLKLSNYKATVFSLTTDLDVPFAT